MAAFDFESFFAQGNNSKANNDLANTYDDSDEDFNFGSEDSGWLASMAAGVPSGIFKIFEGVATLGATLMDLGVDKDRADSVEDFFAKINPFDEAASATAAGKITELIVNLGVPGAPAYRIGSGLLNAGLKAKKAGNYMAKARSIAQGSLATGVTDAIFIGDVEKAGTFGDFMGGPTKINRDEDSPYAEILNRLKFGAEGALFAGAIGGAGAGISKLRNIKRSGKALEGTGTTLAMNKFFKLISDGFSSSSGKNINQFLIDNARKGIVDGETMQMARFRDTIDDTSRELGRKFNKVAGNKISDPKARTDILEQMQDVLVSGPGKDGKMIPRFGAVDEIKKDKLTGFPFRNGEGVLEKISKTAPLNNGKKTVKFKDPETGSQIVENIRAVDPSTGKVKQLYNVTIDAVAPKKLKAFEKVLLNKYKATPDQVKNLFNTITVGREKFAELFTGIGRRLTPESWGAFQTVLKKSLNDVVDRGYNVFQRNAGQSAVTANYPPVRTVLKETLDYYKKVAKQKGYDVGPGPNQIGDDVFEGLVDRSWREASMDKGFVTATGVLPGTPRVTLPNFLTDSVLDNLDNAKKGYIASKTKNLSDITGADLKAVKNLLGKSRNPMSTLVEGVSNLSAQVRSGQSFDNMMIKSNKLKIEYDKWLAAGGKNSKLPEPELPFLFDNTGEAQKYLGGSGADIKAIGSSLSGARTIDRFADSNLKLKGVDNVEQMKINQMTDQAKDLLTNPIAGKYALQSVAEAFTKTDEGFKGLPGMIYNNLVLYPKGTSQMAKTILAPFTHVRNFVSATAFASANGIMPFGNTKDVKAAWNALQAVGPGMRKDNPFYQQLLELGVTNSSVRLKQVTDLLQDAKFGEILNNKNSDFFLNKLMKRFNKIKKGAEDYYAAEDDFWKIFTFLGEKSRIKNAYRDSGLRLGQEFTDINGVKRLFNDRTLNELAADLVRNNVPNYSYVSDFVKALRKFPLGNFVAFPAEILRTGTNIVDTALKEIRYTVKINGKTVRPLAARGRQRLMGMAVTTAAIPLGTIAATETIYDITKEETAAMRRYVADWSKNSVLIPFKKDDGTMQYIDFSHLNAYDTLTRPIQTVLNRVEQGQADDNGIMDDFILGLIESSKELLNPFVSESIWTEALQDVAPILGRNGTDSEGRRVWNVEDTIGDKMQKALAHLVKAQAPLNWKQLTRLGISMFPVDSDGAFDERGNQYEFGNEALGILGLRKVDVDPKKSFNYKITDYKKGVRNSRNLFTSATLKGGIVTPEAIVDAYINANRALYGVNRELYQDMTAAKTLGMSEDLITERMTSRGENRANAALTEGTFRPLTISSDLRRIFEIKAQELGVSNPYDRAQDAIQSIADQLSSVSLRGDLFPDLKNPFDPSLVEGISEFVSNASLPDFGNITNQAPGFTGQGAINTNQAAAAFQASYPNDELSNLYLQNKNKTRLT